VCVKTIHNSKRSTGAVCKVGVGAGGMGRDNEIPFVKNFFWAARYQVKGGSREGV
jgi:hypothetical protein